MASTSQRNPVWGPVGTVVDLGQRNRPKRPHSSPPFPSFGASGPAPRAASPLAWVLLPFGGMNDKKLRKTAFPTRIDLDDQTRAKLVKGLNTAMASTADLRTQVKQAHWNLKGAQFIARHELFDDLADHLTEWTDNLAERATTLGGYAEGTARMVAENTVLPEYDLDAVDGRSHVQALADQYGRYCAHVRKLIAASGDMGDSITEDLFIEIGRQAEMDLWFLEAHLQG